MRANVVAEFRRGAAERDDKQAMALREAAHCYVTMISSVKELTRLRELDSGEKLNPRDKVRATAGRVGLSVPKVRVPSWLRLLYRCSRFSSSLVTPTVCG